MDTSKKTKTSLTATANNQNDNLLNDVCLSLSALYIQPLEDVRDKCLSIHKKEEETPESRSNFLSESRALIEEELRSVILEQRQHNNLNDNVLCYILYLLEADVEQLRASETDLNNYTRQFWQLTDLHVFLRGVSDKYVYSAFCCQCSNPEHQRECLRQSAEDVFIFINLWSQFLSRNVVVRRVPEQSEASFRKSKFYSPLKKQIPKCLRDSFQTTGFTNAEIAKSVNVVIEQIDDAILALGMLVEERTVVEAVQNETFFNQIISNDSTTGKPRDELH